MKQHTKLFAAAIAMAGGFLFAGSVQAQSLTGTPFLSNLDPTVAAANAYGSWANNTPTVFTSTATGLQISSGGGFGGFFIPIPVELQQVLNPADTQFSLTFTFSNPAGSYYVGVNPITLDDNTGGSIGYQFNESDPPGAGYATFGQGTWTVTGTLTGANLAAIQSGTGVINGISLNLDPAGNIPGGLYTLTFNSLVFSAVPEPASMALVGLGAAGLLIFRRRK